MILKEDLKKVIISQSLIKYQGSVVREKIDEIDFRHKLVSIITGIRRCGKSTLLQQLMKKFKNPVFLNFEDPRLINFTIDDFEKTEEIFKEIYGVTDALFYDEIQNIEGWERYIRSVADRKIKTFVTGSNASMLSVSLGSKLTGRYIPYELFPFSYREFLQISKRKPSAESFDIYTQQGGFPEQLKNPGLMLLQHLFDNIISRDVILYNDVRQHKQIKELALYLLSNVSKVYSYNKLSKYFSIKSTNTTIDYVGYLENCYMLGTVPLYTHSIKRQAINPQKVYAIDTGLINQNTLSFSEDKGRLLENLVYLELRRKGYKVFYYKGKNECDFIVTSNRKPVFVVQVAFEINSSNSEREINGLKEAMAETGVNKGFIFTFNQDDKLNSINLIPVWKWFSGKGLLCCEEKEYLLFI